MGKKTKEKKAILVDTNFLIEKKHSLENICKTLKDEYIIYATQLSIDEIKSQEIREIKKQYKYVDNMENTLQIGLKYDKDYVTKAKSIDKIIQQEYIDLVGKNIIPYDKNEKMMDALLYKACFKEPPFIDQSTSDKGFKDAIMWLSMMNFFKDSGEKSVLFLTNDKGFTNNAKNLQTEFNKETGKEILIKNNSYYSELVSPNKQEEQKFEFDEIIDGDTSLINININELRADVDYTVSNVCYIDGYYTNGNSWGKTFILKEKLDIVDIMTMFSMLEYNMQRHLLEIEVFADKVFEIKNKLESTNVKIPMANLDNLVTLYNKIDKNYPQLRSQFFEATVSIFNNNYQKPIEDEDDMPF